MNKETLSPTPPTRSRFLTGLGFSLTGPLVVLELGGQLEGMFWICLPLLAAVAALSAWCFARGAGDEEDPDRSAAFAFLVPEADWARERDPDQPNQKVPPVIVGTLALLGVLGVGAMLYALTLKPYEYERLRVAFIPYLLAVIAVGPGVAWIIGLDRIRRWFESDLA